MHSTGAADAVLANYRQDLVSTVNRFLDAYRRLEPVRSGLCATAECSEPMPTPTGRRPSKPWGWRSSGIVLAPRAVLWIRRHGRDAHRRVLPGDPGGWPWRGVAAHTPATDTRQGKGSPYWEVSMSIFVRFPASGVTREQYDTVRNTLEDGGEWPPDGCELHVCSGDEQDIRVSEVWESQEKFEAFGQALMPQLEQAGIQLSGEPEVSDVHIVDRF
jgi:hypothetical protein